MIEKIVQIIIDITKIDINKIMSRSRLPDIVLARWLIAYYLHWYGVPPSYTAKKILLMNHTSILRGIEMIKEGYTTDYHYALQIKWMPQIEKKLKEQGIEPGEFRPVIRYGKVKKLKYSKI